MLYKTIKIEPAGKRWRYSIQKIEGEREREKRVPSAMGYYHYPAHMKDEDAFNKLKHNMINRHFKEIYDMTRSLDKLVALTFKG